MYLLYHAVQHVLLVVANRLPYMNSVGLVNLVRNVPRYTLGVPSSATKAL